MAIWQQQQQSERFKVEEDVVRVPSALAPLSGLKRNETKLNIKYGRKRGGCCLVSRKDFIPESLKAKSREAKIL